MGPSPPRRAGGGTASPLRFRGRYHCARPVRPGPADRRHQLALRGLEHDPDDPDGFCYISAVIAAINLGLVDEADRLLDDWFALESTQSDHARLFAYGWRALNDTWLKRGRSSRDDAAMALTLAANTGSLSAQAAANWMYGWTCAGVDNESALIALEHGLRLVAQLSPRHLIGQLIAAAKTDISVRAGNTNVAIESCVRALTAAIDHDWLISAGHLLGLAAILLVEQGGADVAAQLLGAMEVVGHTARPRAQEAVVDALGDRADTVKALGSQLSLTAATELAIDELRKNGDSSNR